MIEINVAIAQIGAASNPFLLHDRSSSMMPPHTLKRIRLNLARSKEFPSGSSRHGYELVAPLDPFGRIDPQLWQRYRDHCRVRKARTIKSVIWSIRREGRSTPAGYSTMIPTHGWMTRRAIASGRTSLRPANTSRSMTMPARCTPFRLRPFSQPRKQACVVLVMKRGN